MLENAIEVDVTVEYWSYGIASKEHLGMRAS